MEPKKNQEQDKLKVSDNDKINTILKNQIDENKKLAQQVAKLKKIQDLKDREIEDKKGLISQLGRMVENGFTERQEIETANPEDMTPQEFVDFNIKKRKKNHFKGE